MKKSVFEESLRIADFSCTEESSPLETCTTINGQTADGMQIYGEIPNLTAVHLTPDLVLYLKPSQCQSYY